MVLILGVQLGFWPWSPARAFWSKMSGFGFRVSGLGFRVSGVGFRVSGFGFRIFGLGIWVSGFGFRVSSLGFMGLLPALNASKLGLRGGEDHGGRGRVESCPGEGLILLMALGLRFRVWSL